MHDYICVYMFVHAHICTEYWWFCALLLMMDRASVQNNNNSFQPTPQPYIVLSVSRIAHSDDERDYHMRRSPLPHRPTVDVCYM